MTERSRAEQIAQLEAGIAAQESLRVQLGDAVVDATVAALTTQLATLRAAGPASSDDVLAQLRGYVPQELIDKIRAGGRIEGERKQVTVLFSDLSGFTALSERLDPEEVRAFQDDLFAEMARVVYQYEGFVEKFVGDAVMCFFGAPVAHEDDPARALRAALTMRERMAGINRRWERRLGQPLTLHVGVNTGTVVAGSMGSDLSRTYAVTGDTVNTAARLQSAAEAGQILVSRATQRLARGAFEFRELAPVSVKGKREPVAVYELERARLRPSSARGVEELGAAFVGREAALAQLAAVGEGLRRGEGRLVTVTAEAGLGKTRLMEEWRATLGEEVRWLEGRCFAHTTGLAYAPFLDLFRAFAGITDDHSEGEAREHFRQAAARLFPESAEARAIVVSLLALRPTGEERALLGRLSADDLRSRLIGYMRTLFERLARERATVLLLEDVHWADAASLELAQQLLPIVEQSPLAVVLVYRPESGSPPDRLRAAAGVRFPANLTDVALEPLSARTTLEMVELLLESGTVPPALAALVVGKGEGNPFFVEEVIRTLIERGALSRGGDGEGWSATPLIESVTVPDTLHGVLAARLDRLPDETKRVVQQASVIGRIFLHRVLMQIAEDAPLVDADLTHLERADLIRERARVPEVEYMFRHALTQEVAYGSLLGARRRELHQRTGEAMEQLFSGRLSEFSAIVGDHFLRGEVWEKAAAYLIEAGDAAARVNAFHTARRNYRQALDAMLHLEDTPAVRTRRVETTVKLASVSIGSGLYVEIAERLSEADVLARTLVDDGSVAEGRLRLARIAQWMGRHVGYLSERTPEAVQLYQHALEEARALGDEYLAAQASSGIAAVLSSAGRFREAVEHLQFALPRLGAAGDWSDWARMQSFYGTARAALGDYAGGLEELRIAVAKAYELHYESGISVTHIFLCILYAAGREDQKLLDTSAVVLEHAIPAGDRYYTYLGLAYRGLAECRLGRLEAAAASLAQSRALREALGGRILSGETVLAAAAELAIAQGRAADSLAAVEELIAELTSRSDRQQNGDAWALWALALAAQDPPRTTEALQLAAEAVGLAEQSENTVSLARCRLVYGQLLAAQDRHAAARPVLEQAVAYFERAGMPGLRDTARALLGAGAMN